MNNADQTQLGTERNPSKNLLTYQKGVYAQCNRSNQFKSNTTNLPNRKLKAWYNKKVYTSKKKAMKVCLKKSACKGVTRVGTNKYRLGSTTTTVTASGYKTWIQGGERLN